MFNVFYGQVAVLVVMIIGCTALIMKSRVTIAKLLVALALTLICAMELIQTPLRRRLSRLEGELAQKEKFTPHDPALAGIRKNLDEAKKLYADVAADPRRWPERLPFNLGLDLRGGTEIRLALQLDPARIGRIRSELEDLQKELETLRGEGNPDAIAASEERVAGLESRLTGEQYQIDQDLGNAVDVVRRRLNNSGLAEIPVTRQGNDKILVQLPGMDNSQAEDILAVIQKQGRLEFRLVVGENDELFGRLVARVRELYPNQEAYNLHEDTLLPVPADEVAEDGRSRIDNRMLFDWLKETDEVAADGSVRERPYFLVRKQVEMLGDAIASARAEPDPSRASWRVLLAFDSAGATRFEQITASNLQKQLAIVLDGQLQSAPVIQSRIAGGNAEITGNFDQRSAAQLDVVLKSGSLKVKIEKEYDSSVGATLGEDSIRSGLTAMFFGTIAVIIFMGVYYLVAGLVTDLVLVLNILIILAILAMFGATMTLAGFAGIVLTIGMAVDANVLIFERIREERERGNPLSRAISLGYERAFSTIVDSNITTILTALVLHQFGTEQVKGFALTLMFGLLASMFCSIVVTRWLIDFLVSAKWITDLRMFQVFHRVNINFVGLRRVAYAFSLICLVFLTGLVIWRGENNLGQDFTGGVLANIVTTKPLSMAEAREAAGQGLADFPDARDTLQSYGQADSDGRYSEFVVRTKLVELDADALAEAEQLGEKKFTAENFREALRRSFELIPEGFHITGANTDLNPEGSRAYNINLSLQEAKTPQVVFDLLTQESTVTPLFVGPDGASPEINAGAVVTPVVDANQLASELSIVISVPLLDDTGNLREVSGQQGVIREALQELHRNKALDFTDPFPRFTSVGRTVAKAMESDAAMAIVFSCVIIFIYVWLRFQFRVGFGMGTIIALLHDTLFVIGALALADQLGIMNGQIDLTVMAAILTVMGYSLNDTIVVLDRIREHIGDTPLPSEESINASINQTLSRTIITSATTLFVVLTLLFFGGDVLRGFSYTLLVGVLVGTYSSIFIASPILVEFANYSRRRQKALLDKKTSASLLAGNRKNAPAR
ncbi:MAG: protein translocase subunit SecD [Planctomycetota bacterium]|jgi:SecD/SecF fusion protein|nr:protein translocase subunit SecD [Planctomycetota bacterium]